MRINFSVLLAVVVFFGASGTIIAQSVGKELSAEPLDLTLFGKVSQTQKRQSSVIVADTATITLAHGDKVVNLSAVKTGAGMRVRLEISGATIVASRVRLGSIADIEAGADGTIMIQGRPFTDEELKKALQPSR